FAESLWLSGHAPSSFLPPAGRLSLPAGGRRLVGTTASRKGEAFPQIRRQSRFGALSFGDLDASLRRVCSGQLADRALERGTCTREARANSQRKAAARRSGPHSRAARDRIAPLL